MTFKSLVARLSGRRSQQWTLSPEARSVIQEKLTYLSPEKFARLETAAAQAMEAGVPGHLVEMGIALGGSGIVLAKIAKRFGRRFHGFDVFGLIPAPTSSKDDERAKNRFAIIAAGKSDGIGGDQYYGYKKNLYDEVCGSFERHGVRDVAFFHKGLFSDTLPAFPPESIAVAHIDCDWYDPVKLCLLEIDKRATVGTRIILDDFNDWSGCKEATLEFLQSHPQYEFDGGPNAILTRVK